MEESNGTDASCDPNDQSQPQQTQTNACPVLGGNQILQMAVGGAPASQNAAAAQQVAWMSKSVRPQSDHFEFTSEDYITVSMALSDYDAGPKLTTIDELLKKKAAFEKKIKENLAEISEAYKGLYNRDHNTNADDESRASLLIFDFKDSGIKAVMLCNESNIRNRTGNICMSGNFCIYDGRAPVPYDTYANLYTDQIFYSRYSVPYEFVGDHPEKYHIPNNLFVITDKLYEKLQSDKRFIAFDELDTGITIGHAYCTRSTFSIHYKDVDGSDKCVSFDPNPADGQTEYSMQAGSSRYQDIKNPQFDTRYKSFFLDGKSLSARYILDAETFDFHRHRNHICLGNGSKDSDTYIIDKNMNNIYWKNTENAKAELTKIPKLLTKLTKMMKSVDEENGKPACFVVCIRNRLGLEVTNIKSPKFLALTLNNKDDLDNVFSKILSCGCDDLYYRLSDTDNTRMFFMSKDAVKKTNFRIHDTYEDWNNGTVVTEMTINHGVKKLFSTTSKVIQQQIINMYQNALTEEEFNNMYALALLKK